MVDCAKPKIRKSTSDEFGKTARDMRSFALKDMIVDIGSKATSVSQLTSSEASHNVS